MKKFMPLLTLFALTACATGIPIDKYNSDPAARAVFTLCHGYSCTHKSKAGFTDSEWKTIAAIFAPPAKTAQDERGKIGKAIAHMEKISGAKTGTDEDEGQATSIKKSNMQLDCIDETINTSHYIGFLQDGGLLKFHEVTEPTHRGYILDGKWPHNTAVMQNTSDQSLWVVDAFYRANGEEPYIVPRADWLAGWKPPGATQ